jgi:hypothetical protein
VATRSSGKYVTMYRSSVTDRFVKAGYAKKYPRTTEKGTSSQDVNTRRVILSLFQGDAPCLLRSALNSRVSR